MTDEVFYLVDCKDGEQRLYRGRPFIRAEEAIPFHRMEEFEETGLWCKTCESLAHCCECDPSERNLTPYTIKGRRNPEALGKWAVAHLDELQDLAKGNSDGTKEQ